MAGIRPRLRLSLALALAIAAAVVVPTFASGSILVTQDGRKPSLKVGANGSAEVGWTDKSGNRQRLLIPMRGLVLPGGKITGKNVATKTRKWKLPFKPILRKGPKNFFYAVQRWRPKPGGPLEIRFARWKGRPTQLALEAAFNGTRESLSGSVVFRGKPVFGTSPTPAGKKLKIFVLLDCFDCARASGGTGWGRIAGKALKSKDGTYALNLLTANEGSKYRAQIAGPNRGLHLGPDVRAIAKTARPAPAES